MARFITLKNYIIDIENIKAIEKTPSCIYVYLKNNIGTIDNFHHRFDALNECDDAYNSILSSLNDVK